MKKTLKLLLTLTLITTAGFFGYYKYEAYINNPWTRDGQVRTQVIQVTPRVNGMVTKIHVEDNQKVKIGDLLFEIDPSQYQVNLDQAKARLQRTLESAKGTKIEFDRVRNIYAKDKGAVSQKDLVRNETNYYKSLAEIDSSKEAVNTAKLNLSYTKVYAEVDGYVSNINFQIGSQATAGQPILALVDENSYWVFGFFREDAIPEVEVGDSAIVTLLAYPDTPLSAKVESIAWGISHSDGNPGNNLLPSVKPVFQWIRLAQRIPVRLKLDPLPKNVKLRFGLTASVMILKNENKQEAK
ncbi:MAG TPA: HlyD family secretion protein [Sulfurovum sp.]|jgi:multidrug resistance efflux pump|nr:MAG: efflux transporter periplasmic adaptor subunit [Sulfurovum sp. 35-42-20]OYY57260.1 MAG: efflux transporter periplasmic adaptor subunit [Sulfurovum sp. 28-43-6]OYZ25025.1 MAG: efflux transporter periplasmic adaptor subunit [Sulfurovum sp. 16-42-52]OYZ49386.1 MAG: efflux transporter periplasmic adaptor subunit [Sulfurovum sp. 24-42-9]OZA45020.1 MAG: efflux transporter periplasmic adaptor subunit [Sulfurovum sp. 17-42-90]OZA59754.1 MAG: efflux transporter periplasmic adaptor subunit [Sulf